MSEDALLLQTAFAPAVFATGDNVNTVTESYRFSLKKKIPIALIFSHWDVRWKDRYAEKKERKTNLKVDPELGTTIT